MRNGMGWLCIDVDMFQFLLQRLPQYSLLESSLQPFRCTRMSLTTHMAERSPLLLCIISTKGTSFVFATHCLFIFLHPCVRFCMLKAFSTYISKTAVNAQSSSGLSASMAENCLSFLLYNAFRCRNGLCGWCAGRNDRSIRVEISGLLAKVLTSTGWLRSV